MRSPSIRTAASGTGAAPVPSIRVAPVIRSPLLRLGIVAPLPKSSHHLAVLPSTLPEPSAGRWATLWPKTPRLRAPEAAGKPQSGMAEMGASLYRGIGSRTMLAPCPAWLTTTRVEMDGIESLDLLQTLAEVGVVECSTAAHTPGPHRVAGRAR